MLLQRHRPLKTDPSHPPKTIHLLVGLTVGGIENQLLRILPRLQTRGYRCKVCSLKGDGPLAEAFRDQNIEVIPLGGTGKYDARVLWRLHRCLKRERPDLLHCYTTRANRAGAVIGRAANVPIVVLSDREIRAWMNALQRWFDRQCFLLAEGMAVPSRAVRAYDADRLRLPRERIWVIPNAVSANGFHIAETKKEIREELGLSANAELIGFIGRLDPVKGLPDLLRASAMLKRNGSGPYLMIVGEGPMGEALNALAARLGSQDRIRFLGTRRDIPRVLKALDLLVLPSYHEGCPNVVLESMAAGIPVVATRVGGIPELIVHGDTGWLVSPADPEGLAEAIQTLLRNPTLANAVSRKAKQWVQKNRSMETALRAYVTLYRSLLE